MENWKHEMYVEMRELLGGGYVPSYYEQAAEGFIRIAEAAIGEALSDSVAQKITRSGAEKKR